MQSDQKLKDLVAEQNQLVNRFHELIDEYDQELQKHRGLQGGLAVVIQSIMNGDTVWRWAPGKRFKITLSKNKATGAIEYTYGQELPFVILNHDDVNSTWFVE